MKKFFLVSFLATLMCMAVSGCGDKTPEDVLVEAEKLNEDNLQEVIINPEDESLDENQGSVENEEASVDDGRIMFEPVQEIIDAEFNSGKIQVYDDVFREGGYFTVDEFINQYSNKYDCSVIDVDRIIQKTDRKGVLSEINSQEPFIQLNRTDIYKENDAYYPKDENMGSESSALEVGIRLYYVFPTEANTRLGDCIVYRIDATEWKEMWFPGGNPYADDTEFTYTFESFAKDFLEPNGLIKYTSDDELSGSAATRTLNLAVSNGEKYAVNCYEEMSKSAYYFAILGKDENLLGIKPVYRFYFDENFETGIMEYKMKLLEVYYECELLPNSAEW